MGEGCFDIQKIYEKNKPDVKGTNGKCYTTVQL